MRSNATVFRLGGTQTITTSGTSAAISTALGAQTYAVRIHTTQAAHIAVGPSGTAATTGHALMGAGATEYFTVSPGEFVAAIQDSTAGTVYVTELTH